MANNKIKELIKRFEKPKRKAFSIRFPFFKKPILFIRRTIRKIQNTLDNDISFYKSDDYFECVVTRHQSVLRRKLGDSNPILQEKKITNISKAIEKLDKIVIEPGKIFSFWEIVGQPKYKSGYVDGMLLSNGKVVEGIGGGLCQLSNFLFWIFLHSPVEIIERYHHSMDVFPDSGRTLPFGSGATILYNFVDLKIRNISKSPIQLKLWLTDKHLKGQILSKVRIKEKYHVYEKQHLFINHKNKYFRYNQIWRETKVEGKTLKNERLLTNFAPVLYKVDKDYIKRHNYVLTRSEEL